MKTCIFAPCWLDEGDRLARNIKYLQYYKPLLPLLGADSIHLYDNASSLDNIKALVDVSGMTLNKDLFITRFAIHMSRKAMLDYPYCWRVLRQSGIDLSEQGYDKIICIDTDLFILKQRVIDYINTCNKGWVAFWDETNNFPESAFMIINADQFDKYIDEGRQPIFYRAGQTMETVLPFTHVEKGFHGGRFNEVGILPDSTMDFYGQCEVKTEVKFCG